jgi:outer membrane protein assembly factor BamB
MKSLLRFISLFVLFPCIFLFLTEFSSYGQEDEPEETVSGEWLTFRGNPEHTGKTSVAGPPEEIEMKWRWRMNDYDDRGPISASPAVTSEGTVYIATEGGYLAAINHEGGPGWVYNVSGPVKSSPSVESSGNVLAITADGYMYYLDSSGELQWKCDLDVDISTSPVISGGVAYLGTDDKTLLAINLTPEMSGIETESRKLLKSDVIKWYFLADGTVKSSPAFYGNTVFFGGGNYFYAINPTAGGGDNTTSQVKWMFDIHDKILSSPAVYNDRVYVGANDGYLYVFKENV